MPKKMDRATVDQVYDEILQLHNSIEKEHWALEGWFGIPTRKHYELMAQSRILLRLGQRLVALRGEIQEKE